MIEYCPKYFFRSKYEILQLSIVLLVCSTELSSQAVTGLLLAQYYSFYT